MTAKKKPAPVEVVVEEPVDNFAAAIEGVDHTTCDLVVLVMKDGSVRAVTAATKRASARAVRELADAWDQEWKTEIRNEQKRIRDARRAS